MNQHVDVAKPQRRRAGAADYAEARESYAAGGGIDHIVMREWLLTWGSADFLPLEEWLNAQNG